MGVYDGTRRFSKVYNSTSQVCTQTADVALQTREAPGSGPLGSKEKEKPIAVTLPLDKRMYSASIIIFLVW